MRYIIIVLVFVAIIIVQMTLVPLLSFGTFKPDLLAVLISIIGIKYGRSFGMINGFVLGLIFDLLSGGIIGLSSFSKTINGFIGGYFYDPDNTQEKMTGYKLLLVMFLCVSIDNFFYNFISGATLSVNLFDLIFEASLLPAFYSIIVVIPVIFFRERLEV